MSRRSQAKLPGIRLRLPATSANLGPGFDAAGLALALYLEIEAHPAAHDRIDAHGRDADRCGELKGNLVLETYRGVMEAANREADPLRLTVENEIPLGMGCGSSAAARLAGVALANHFGQLAMDDEAIVAEASRREGHPDNVAACWYGGFTVSAPDEKGGVSAATFACDGTWQLLLALPATGLATETARALLPEQISRADAVFNVQRVALLTAAFAKERLDLLRMAMEDRLHQPYRSAACTLLQQMDRLQGAAEFAGVALSGAGPALLAILAERATLHGAQERLQSILGGDVELIPARIAGGAEVEVLPQAASLP